METIAIKSDEFIQYGCPCCCKFNVGFYQLVLGTRIMKCNKTNKTFYIVIGKSKSSAIRGTNGEEVNVTKHPLGQM